jgi:broad specificity phosphatase PhoE
MGILHLVRHAQASFLQPNYDKLFPLGETQSRLLGEHWAKRKIIFDRVAVGPCARHKDTLKLVSAGYHKAGLNFPEPQALPEFDEYHAEEVLRATLPTLLEKDQQIRDLHAAFQAATNNTEQRASLQTLFAAVIGDWVRGVISLEGVEAWQEFCARVNSGLTSRARRGICLLRLRHPITRNTGRSTPPRNRVSQLPQSRPQRYKSLPRNPHFP